MRAMSVTSRKIARPPDGSLNRKRSKSSPLGRWPRRLSRTALKTPGRNWVAAPAEPDAPPARGNIFPWWGGPIQENSPPVGSLTVFNRGSHRDSNSLGLDSTQYHYRFQRLSTKAFSVSATGSRPPGPCGRSPKRSRMCRWRQKLQLRSLFRI